MRRVKWIVGAVCVVLAAMAAGEARASIIISEILADPAPGLLGDANNDGIGSTSQDEFIEFFNAGGEAVNLSGWSLSDAVGVRHVFGANTFLSSNSYLVLFSGGNPQLPGINSQTASTGSLGLNNSGDTLSLYDNAGTLIHQIIYNSLANHDESIVLWEDEWVQHSSIAQADGALFSPGTDVDGSLPSAAAVPEPASMYLLAAGMLALAGRGRKKVHCV